MSLAELQKNFAKHIYNKSDSAIIPKISSKDICALERLNIYRNNVLGSFDDALTLTYPITKKIVGDDCFQSLIKNYHQKYTSTSGDLEEYGQLFPKLIKDLQSEHNLAYLSNIATLEWHYNLSYFSIEVPNINLKKLQSLDNESFMSLTLKTHPSCHLLSSKYPIYSIWEINNSDSREEVNLEKENEQYILISRADFKVNVEQLSKTEYSFLNMIQKQNNIYKIYESLSIKNKNFDIGTLINKFISSKIIINFKTEND
jgi:hypothetical protein